MKFNFVCAYCNGKLYTLFYYKGKGIFNPVKNMKRKATGEITEIKYCSKCNVLLNKGGM